MSLVRNALLLAALVAITAAVALAQLRCPDAVSPGAWVGLWEDCGPVAAWVGAGSWLVVTPTASDELLIEERHSDDSMAALLFGLRTRLDRPMRLTDSERTGPRTWAAAGLTLERQSDRVTLTLIRAGRASRAWLVPSATRGDVGPALLKHGGPWALLRVISEAWWFALMASAASIVSYFALGAGVTLWTRSRRRPAAIQRHPIPEGQYRREVGFSLVGLPVTGLELAVVFALQHAGIAQLYARLDAYGWAYLPASFVLLAVLHDAYFYWVHRLLHRRGLFRWVHRCHHLSRTPRVWSAYQMSVLEYAIATVFVIAFVVVIPLHVGVLALYMSGMFVRSALGHLGYELFPSGASRGPWRLLTTVTHHDMHHEHPAWNFGLYFRYWDLLMNTEHPDYPQRFVAAKRS